MDTTARHYTAGFIGLSKVHQFSSILHENEEYFC